MVKRVNIRELLSKEQVFAPCVHVCMSARTVEMCGYNGIFLSGGTTANSMLGMPDIAAMSLDELVWATTRIADYSYLPLFVDADHGYGEGPLNVYRTACRLQKAGAVGFSIEDTAGVHGWERMTHNNENESVIPVDDWLAKLRAAKAATEGSDCIVIARTETKFSQGLDAAIERCQRALDVGADMTMIVGIKTIDDCRRIAEKVPGWKMYPDLFSHDGIPDVNIDEVYELGFNLVTIHYLQKGAMYGMMKYGMENFKNKSAVFSDQHDMGGLTEEEQKKLRGFDAPYWFDLERQFRGE